MFAATLGRNRSRGAFNQFQQGLLHALARHVAGDRGVVRLARNLVDLVNVDNTLLGLFHIVITFLQQLLDDIFDILTDIACLCQRRGVRHHKGDVQQTRQCLGK